MAVLAERGMLLESGRGPLPDVAELVAGEPIRGSWWGHTSSHAIYSTLTCPQRDPDVLEMCGGALIVGLLGSDTPHLGQRAIDRPDHLGQCDLLGPARQSKPTIGTSHAVTNQLDAGLA